TDRRVSGHSDLEWSTVRVVALPLIRASNDDRAGAEILDRARPDDEGVQGGGAHKHVSYRGLEIIEAVVHESVVSRNRGRSVLHSRHTESGSGASPNPIVPHYVALSVAVDQDRGAEIAQDGARGRRHGHIVVHDDGALHGPGCKLAKHTDAYGVWKRPS